MTGARHQLVEYPRVGGRVISGDLGRRRPVVQGAGEESPGGRQVPLLGDQHVNDLPELVDGPVQIHPPSGDLGVVSSTNQQSPGACRHGLAASINNGVKCCTHRKIVTWVMPCSYTAWHDRHTASAAGPDPVPQSGAGVLGVGGGTGGDLLPDFECSG